MSNPKPDIDTVDQALLQKIRSNCTGSPPLDARLEPWQVHALDYEPLHRLIEQWGSPLNLLHTALMARNIESLDQVARSRRIDFRVYFARKANKCLSLVDEAYRSGAGIDVASEQELAQVLQRDIGGQDVICTAAVKSRNMLELCVRNGVTVALDNLQEIRDIKELSNSLSTTASVALRLSGFHHAGTKLHSRFGIDIHDTDEILVSEFPDPMEGNVRVDGLHFHLDGYSAPQRVSAIEQCLPVFDQLHAIGHAPAFLDIGGGLPMSYLEGEPQWKQFWDAHDQALLGKTPPVTYRNHGLGRIVVNGELHGEPKCYPYFQSPIREQWLAGVLDAPSNNGTIADAIADRSIQLRCEPGRSLLDGCGMTIARVEFTKQHPSGDWFAGLAMNRTQCRTSSDDFLVDPLLIRAEGNTKSTSTANQAGYLVGAYCTESELLLLRKMQFPGGIAAGDLIALPNTAGYLMHFLESRSHQFPLAKNLVAARGSRADFCLDDIDAASASPV